jgi:hypothetical protein
VPHLGLASAYGAGRAVLLAVRTRLRSPLAALREVHPEVAALLEQLRTMLDARTSDSVQSVGAHVWQPSRIAAAIDQTRRQYTSDTLADLERPGQQDPGRARGPVR